MKIKITATTIIDTDEPIEVLTDNYGEAAFIALTEAGQFDHAASQFSITVVPVGPGE